MVNFYTGSYLLARGTTTTDTSKHSVYYLNETQDEFNPTKCQEDRKQRDIPFHYMLGFDALGPCGAIQKVTVDEKKLLTHSHTNGMSHKHTSHAMFFHLEKKKINSMPYIRCFQSKSFCRIRNLAQILLQ